MPQMDGIELTKWIRIRSVDGQEILMVRDRLIPLVKLSDVLDVKTEDTGQKLVYVVLMAIAEKRVEIIVDELCHQGCEG